MSSVFTPHAVKWDLLQLCCLCVLAQAAEEIYTGLEGAGFACLFMPYGLFFFLFFFFFFQANRHQSFAALRSQSDQ